MRFGGAAMVSGEPAALTRIAAGQVLDLGITRYQSVQGGFVPAAYAFRALLDERGCRFPTNYNPPVHWEQLYDMEGAWDDRPHRYTRAVVEKEAAKGRDYHCEALYLDPGWDTSFGSFVWGQDWLGAQEQFTREIGDLWFETGSPLSHATLGVFGGHVDGALQARGLARRMPSHASEGIHERRRRAEGAGRARWLSQPGPAGDREGHRILHLAGPRHPSGLRT